jgi:probable rRNA maturation factor
MSVMNRVRFHSTGTGGLLKQRKDLKNFIIQLFATEGHALQSIDYILCSDTELLEINRKFLQHDYYTDIITFNLSDAPQIVGEVYISTDRVKENAKHFGIPFSEELYRVMFHGALHLCGYKDKKASEKKEMRAKEDEYLKKYLK